MFSDIAGAKIQPAYRSLVVIVGAAEAYANSSADADFTASGIVWPSLPHHTFAINDAAFSDIVRHSGAAFASIFYLSPAAAAAVLFVKPARPPIEIWITLPLLPRLLLLLLRKRRGRSREDEHSRQRAEKGLPHFFLPPSSRFAEMVHLCFNGCTFTPSRS